MNANQVCVRCGFPLERSARGEGWCPRCLARSVDSLMDEPDLGVDEVSPLPRTFGGYEVRDEIGRGGMGVVYRARQTALDRLVALKLLLGGVYSSEAMLSRFRVEAAAAAALQHPNIVPVYDYGEWEGRAYYAMELVAGRDLAHVCAGHPLPAQHAAEILRELAGAVHYAHQKGIVHRDLKPSNVLMDESGQPHITDFGLARRLDESGGATVTGQMLGSPSYASPEQAAGRREEISITSDVYGLGALFYHLLTGRAPFGAATPTEILRLVLDADPVPPHLLNPALPRDLETICLKCLAKVPARRYASAADVAGDIERYLSSRPILARPPSRFYRMCKFVRRHRLGVVAAAAVLVALLAGLAVALVGLRHEVVARNAADLARAQAEELLTRVQDDLQPELMDRVGLKLARASIESAIHYYETLPSYLRDVKTEQRHAAALETLLSIRKSAGDRNGLEQIWREAVALRRKIAAKIPSDADAAAELLKDEYSAQSSLMVLSDDTRAQTDDRVRQEIINQWRQLYNRFPESPRVKLGLASELLEYAWLTTDPWHGLYRPQDGRAAAEEARPLVEELSATSPNQPSIRGLRFFVARVLAASEPDNGEAAYKQLVAELEKDLQENPGSFRARTRLAFALSNQSFAIAKISLKRAADVSREAREQFRMLMRLDPANQAIAEACTHTYINECFYLAWGDGMIEPARKAWREWDAACEPFRERDERNRRERWWRSLARASLAAQAGDAAEARALIQEGSVRFDFYRDRLPNDPRDRRRARIDFLPQLAWPLLYLHDWVGLERVAREYLDAIDAALREQPADPDLLLNHAMALRYLGHALLQEGRIDESAPLLERAVAEFRDTPLTPTTESWADIRLDARECLAEAMMRRGEVARARDLLEDTLKRREDRRTAAHNSWLSRQAVAITLVKLGTTYADTDPTEMGCRAELLARAAAILNSPEAEDRITMEGKAAKANLDRLRAAVSKPE